MSVPMYSAPLDASVVQLICVSTMRGSDTPENPSRMAYFYYTFDGELVACYDPINGPVDSFGDARRKANLDFCDAEFSAKERA